MKSNICISFSFIYSAHDGPGIVFGAGLAQHIETMLLIEERDDFLQQLKMSFVARGGHDDDDVDRIVLLAAEFDRIFKCGDRQTWAVHCLTRSRMPQSESGTDISAECGVSTATLSRFARTLGYSTFSQLRWALASELNTQTESVEDINAADSPKTVARKTLAANIETLTGTFALINEHDLVRARDYIVHARKLGFYGLGGSNIVALDAYHKFMRMPIAVIHDIEYHMALMQTALMDKRDCAIVISHTGNDTDTLVLAEALRNNDVPIIAITSFADSPLAEYGDVVFYSISKDSKTHLEALESFTSQLAINDCLYALTAQYFGKRGEENRNRIRAVISAKHPAS